MVFKERKETSCGGWSCGWTWLGWKRIIPNLYLKEQIALPNWIIYHTWNKLFALRFKRRQSLLPGSYKLIQIISQLKHKQINLLKFLFIVVLGLFTVFDVRLYISSLVWKVILTHAQSNCNYWFRPFDVNSLRK